MSAPEYLDESRIIETKSTPAPQRTTRTGYGSKLPTEWMLRLAPRKQWFRVYAVNWSNASSMYIVENGTNKFLGTIQLKESSELRTTVRSLTVAQCEKTAEGAIRVGNKSLEADALRCIVWIENGRKGHCAASRRIVQVLNGEST